MNTNFCYKFLLLAAFLVSATAICVGAEPKFTLVLDAGHGGRDVGCQGTITQEKDINLRATLMLGKLIKANCPDVSVIYTRQNDVFIPLHERADIANKAKADLFISIHTNSGPHTTTAKGFETWTMGIRRSDEKLSAAKRENDVILIEKDYEQHYEGYDPNSPESNIMFEFMLDKNMEKSVEMARYIQNSVCNDYGRASRGVKQDVFLVLRETSMPACLVELGFITNAEEQELLANDSTLAPTVQGIYEAFVKYKNKYSATKTTIVSKKNASTEQSVKAVEQSAKVVEPNDQTTELVRQVAPAMKQIDTMTKDADNASRETKKTKKTSKTKEDSKAKNTSTAKVDSKPKNTPTAKADSKPKNTSTAKEDSKPKVVAKKESTTHTYIYKVQILTSNRALRSDSEQLKGHTDVDSYREGDMVKYTIGSSDDYDDMVKLRKKLLSDFPDAFVIAYKDGEKMLASEARLEQKQETIKHK